MSRIGVRPGVNVQVNARLNRSMQWGIHKCMSKYISATENVQEDGLMTHA